MKIQPPYLPSTIDSAVAREFAIGKTLRRFLPPIKDATYRLAVNTPLNRRAWCQALPSFLLSATPYYALLAYVGKWAIINSAALTTLAAKHIHPLITVTVFTIASILAFPRLFARRKQRRIHGIRRFRDSSALLAIAFFAESESWTERQRLQACAVYSLTLQARGIFPIFTVLTAILSNRLMMAIYHSELARTGSREAALSHVLTVRLMRLTLVGLATAFIALAAVIA